MKKIVLLLLLIIPNIAYAYENDEGERRYKYYKLENIYGPYELESEENEEFPLINYDDFVYGKYGDWTFEKEDKDFIEKVVYKYKTISNTNKIILTDFSSPDYYVDVKNIKVYYEGNEVPYKLSCNLCEKDFENKMKNDKARIQVNGRVVLELDNEYPLENLNTKVDIINAGDWITWIKAKYQNDDLIIAGNSQFLVRGIGDASFNIIGDKLPIINKDKIVYKDYKEENDKFELLAEEKMYKYRDVFYQKYKQEKVYTDYLSTPPSSEYIKDENLYKDFIINEYESELKIQNKISDEVLTEDSNKLLDDVSDSEKIYIIEDEIKTKGSDFTNENIQNDFKKTYGSINQKPKIDNQNDYSYLLIFLLIPFLLFIKIILVLSKLYKEKQKSVNL